MTPYAHVSCYCTISFLLRFFYNAEEILSLESTRSASRRRLPGPHILRNILHFTKWRTPCALCGERVYIHATSPQNQKCWDLSSPLFLYPPSVLVVHNEALLGPSGLTSEHRYYLDGRMSCVSVLWIQSSRYGRRPHPRVFCEGISSVGYHQHHGSPKHIQREYSRSVVALLLDYTSTCSYP